MRAALFGAAARAAVDPAGFGRCQRIRDQRLPGRPHELLDPGLRRLRDPRNDVEARLRPGGSRPPRASSPPTCPRAGRVPRGSRSYFVLKAPQAPASLASPGPARPAAATAATPSSSGQAAPMVHQRRSRTSARTRAAPDADTPRRPAGPAPAPSTSAAQRRSSSAIVCVGERGAPHCSSRGLNYIRTFKAQVTVVDVSPPAVSVRAGQPVYAGAVGAGCADGELLGGGQCGGEAGACASRPAFCEASTTAAATSLRGARVNGPGADHLRHAVAERRHAPEPLEAVDARTTAGAATPSQRFGSTTRRPEQWGSMSREAQLAQPQ